MEINKNIIHGYPIPNINYNRQYDIIEPYVQSWINWSTPAIHGKNDFSYYIPINGIVEAIEKICCDREVKRFVIFEGEVGFYENILKTQQQNYIKINPSNIQEIKSTDLVCLSMPFSATGTIPEWYEELCLYLEEHDVDTFIDGAYIGTINKKIYIPKTCKFFALSCSKPFNAAGLRIGILYCDEIINAFKAKIKLANYNYYAMHAAINLLENYNCHYVYEKYRLLQETFCAFNNLICSDSAILSYTYDLDHNLKDKMIMNEDLKILRLCMPKVLTT